MRENRRAVCQRITAWGSSSELKRLVCDKDDGDIFFCSGAVLHRYALREPNKASRPIVTSVRDERAFQYVHAACAQLCVWRGLITPAGYRTIRTSIPVSGSSIRFFRYSAQPILSLKRSSQGSDFVSNAVISCARAISIDYGLRMTLMLLVALCMLTGAGAPP